jgi:hypothetical protein
MGGAWVALDRDGPTLEHPGPESPGKPGPAGLYTTGVTQFYSWHIFKVGIKPDKVQSQELSEF